MMNNPKFKMKHINNKNIVSGITLISLIITIIVLLILAGVSISILTGENGVITRTNMAKLETRGASVEEAKNFWEVDKETDHLFGSSTAQTLEELLDDLEYQGLITATERKTIETTGQVQIGSRKIVFNETLEDDGEELLKIMNNPPQITVYEDDINSSPYKLQSLQLNGEINPIYTSYNSTLSGSSVNIIGSNGASNTTYKVPNSYAIEFTVDCSDFVFRTASFFRISVDEGNGYELTSYEGFTDNPYTWSNFKVQFSEKKERNIKIELTNALFGVYLRDADTISKLERESNPTALFVGTSITQGVYKYSNVTNTIVGYPYVVSNILGFECMNNGIGGTGYLTTGAFNTFYDRLVYAVENIKPDIIFIEGGPNDVDRYDADDIVAEAKRCHEYIKANAPDTKLIIIGLYHHTGYEYLQNQHLDLNTKLRAEALEYGLPYIDLLTGDTIAGDGTILTEGYVSNENGNSYITGDGNVSNKKGNGNADIYVDSDNYHPTVEGYKFLGIKLSTEIKKILEYEK